MNKNILKLLVAAAALAFTSCSQFDQPQSDAAGALHIASVSIDGQEGVQTRVTYGETVTHEHAYNLSITGLEDGNELVLKYGFSTSDAKTARATKSGSGWTLTSDENVTINPINSGGGTWENVYMDASFGGGNIIGSDDDYSTIATSMNIVQGNSSDIPIDNIKLLSDALYADSNTGGGISIVKDLHSPTLGATTIILKHNRALLRLPESDAGFNVATTATYIVDGIAYNVSGLATLWAVVEDNDDTFYYPFTRVSVGSTSYLQVIVPAGTLTAFKAVLYATEIGNNTPTPSSNESEQSTVTIDLPFKVDGNASQGMSLVVNTCYPLTLNISPNNAEVSLTSASAKPGWGSKENELNNDMNELIPAAITQLKYINSYDSRSYFEVSGPQGLILMNKWMAGLVTNEFMHGLNIEGAQNVFLNQYYESVKPMSAIIKLAADITLPEDYVWSPIGTDNNPYTGWFDGANFTITNLTVNNTSDGYVGFVGAMTGMVSNLKLENVSINGKYAGGVAGKVSGYSSLVSNCIVEGKVTGTICVGGIVGTSNAGRVNGCINNADVELKNPTASYNCSAGGVIGSMSNGARCICCANTGVISINVPYFNIGGVAGVVSGGSSNVIGCWTINTYKNKETSTSLYPIVYQESYPIIKACYAVSNDTSGKEKLAGKIGYVDDSTSGETMSMNKALKNETYYWLHSQTGDWPTITTTKPTMPDPS